MEKETKAAVQALNEEDAEILQAIELLKTKLLPRLSTLTPKERQRLVKMGDKSIPFVEKAHDYCLTNEHLVSRAIDLEDYGRHLDVVNRHSVFAGELLPIYDALRDTILVSGSRAYNYALMFYNDLRSAMRAKLHNARQVYDDLAERFAQSRKGDKPVA